MKIIAPKYILTPDELLVDKAIAFDKTIKKIAPLSELKKEFKDATITQLNENTLLLAGLINAHVHLEFSANKNELSYGSFVPWLYSVIDSREELMSECGDDCMSEALKSMLYSGTTTIGAISSNGYDLEVCAASKLNIVFFNELIGSQASMADMLFGNFLARLDESKEVKRDGFYPAIALHSPYSVHPILVKKALDIAKNESLRLSAHFMESQAEREWLDSSSGEFKEFFEKFLNQSQSVSSSSEFLDYFDGHTALFTHCTKANDDELKKLKNQHIVHCPVSNRLLGNGVLDLKKLDEFGINYLVATDGLSSNYGLNLFEELRVALFMHSHLPLNELAKKLLLSVTKNAAKALKLNKGEIKEGFDADMIVLELDSVPSREIYSHIIIKGYNVSHIFIAGERVK